MTQENQLSRYGAVTKVLEKVSPYSKAFFVGDSDDTGYVNFVNEFPPDRDGVVRSYSSMFDSTMLANTRDGRGDVILVMPGHSEDITTDRAYTTRGLKVIGLGEGDARPIVTFSHANASISLDTASIQLENFRLRANITAVARGVDMTGDGCVLRKNSFEYVATNNDFAINVTAFGDRAVIEDNEILGEDTVGATHGIQLSSSAFSKVRRNYITGQFSNAGISDTAASEGLLIGDNFINNQDTAASIGIAGTSTSRGIVYNNRIATADSTAGALSSNTYGGFRWLENYATDGDSAGGIVVPAVTSS